MNRFISSLEKALPIVAAAYGEQFDVKVILTGDSAKTDGKTIYLPMLESMSELKDVLFGYLAHEAAHVRFTDFTCLTECTNDVEFLYTNLFEDVRIEQLMQEVFPGTKFTLTACWDYMVDNKMTTAANKDENEASQLFMYLLHRLRSEISGRRSSDELALKSREVIENTFSPAFIVRLDVLLNESFPLISCTSDCLVFARAVLKALEESESDDPRSDSPESSSSNEPEESGEGRSDTRNNESGSKPNDPSGGDTVDDDSYSQYEKVCGETDLPKDAFKELAEVLSSESKAGVDEGLFNLEVTNVGSPMPNTGNKETLHKGILFSSVIRSRLQGLLQAQTKQHKWLHTRGKRVEGKRLARLSSGDTRVFVNKNETKKIDTSVHLLLDCSSSMRGTQDVANQASVSLALAISSIPNCDIGVSVFPGLNSASVSSVVKRGRPVRSHLGMFDVASHGGTPLAEAMVEASRDLSSSNKSRKVLIIVTDGEPNSGDAVHYINKLINPHIDTYAIGIGSDVVSNYFKNWIQIDGIEELQNALFNIAGRVLNLK